MLSGAVALALLGAGVLASSARADEEVDADVGGGVAGIQATLTVESPTLFGDIDNNDYATVDGRVSAGRSAQGRRQPHASAVNQKFGPIKVKSLFTKISGNRTGDPYAAGQSVLKGIEIAGTKLGALDVTCIWDRSGPRGATTVTDLNRQRRTTQRRTPPPRSRASARSC